MRERAERARRRPRARPARGLRCGFGGGAARRRDGNAAARRSVVTVEVAREVALETVRERMHAVEREVTKVVLGLDRAVRLTAYALFARGHVLYQGLPGRGRRSWPRASPARSAA